MNNFEALYCRGYEMIPFHHNDFLGWPLVPSNVEYQWTESINMKHQVMEIIMPHKSIFLAKKALIFFGGGVEGGKFHSRVNLVASCATIELFCSKLGSFIHAFWLKYVCPPTTETSKILCMYDEFHVVRHDSWGIQSQLLYACRKQWIPFRTDTNYCQHAMRQIWDVEWIILGSSHLGMAMVGN